MSRARPPTTLTIRPLAGGRTRAGGGLVVLAWLAHGSGQALVEYLPEEMQVGESQGGTAYRCGECLLPQSLQPAGPLNLPARLLQPTSSTP